MKKMMLLITTTIIALNGCGKENTQDVSWCDDAVKDFNNENQREVITEITATLSNGKTVSCRKVTASDTEAMRYLAP